MLGKGTVLSKKRTVPSVQQRGKGTVLKKTVRLHRVVLPDSRLKVAFIL